MLYLRIPAEYRNALANVRHWPELRMAPDGDYVWVTGLKAEQLKSPDIRSLPGVAFFEERNSRLYEPGKLLPAGPVPALLWTPLKRALPVGMPDLNHNYFQLEEAVRVQLTAARQEHEAQAMRLPLAALAKYAQQAPAVRLQPLRWSVIGQREALVLGAPLLPLKFATYWLQHRLLLPVGMQLNAPMFARALSNKLCPNPGELALLVPPAQHIHIATDTPAPLSRTAVNQTLQALESRI